MKAQRHSCLTLRQYIPPTQFEHLGGTWAVIEDPSTGKDVALARPAYVNLLGNASALLDALKMTVKRMEANGIAPDDWQAYKAAQSAIEAAEAIEPTAEQEAARDRERMRAYYHTRLLAARGKFEQAELRAKIAAL